MQTILLLVSNPLINMCFLAWFVAQILKTLFDWFANKSINLERMVGSGGMPSSHSALVVSLAVGTARIEGFNSTAFTIALALAAIVMYDAMGVRRAAGEQAKVINKMMFDFDGLFEDLKNHFKFNFDDDDATDEHKTLKEFLGHTPLEVTAGCLLGILVAVSYPL